MTLGFCPCIGCIFCMVCVALYFRYCFVSLEEYDGWYVLLVHLFWFLILLIFLCFVFALYVLLLYVLHYLIFVLWGAVWLCLWWLLFLGLALRYFCVGVRVYFILSYCYSLFALWYVLCVNDGWCYSFYISMCNLC